VLGSESQERIIANILLVSGACGSRTRVRGYLFDLPIPRERRPVHTFTCHYLPQRGAGFGKDLATGWGKTKEPLGCPKLKSMKEASKKATPPLTGGHDDVIKNKKYMKIELTIMYSCPIH
jgi:hypothetical protein